MNDIEKIKKKKEFEKNVSSITKALNGLVSEEDVRVSLKNPMLDKADSLLK